MDRPAGRRALPSTDRILRSPSVARLLAVFDRDVVVWLVRRELDRLRSDPSLYALAPSPDDLGFTIAAHAMAAWRASPRKLLNATGVLLHTNLGRAPLSTEAVQAISQAASYADLEFDLASGLRSSRQAHIEEQVVALTGAQAAHVVVNNGAAITLALAALARGKEVIVSRGQSVEIGGGFRVPDVLRQSGARLVDVGTTNRTTIDDYDDALSPRTAAILHVHSSNFRIAGFTQAVSLKNLADLARSRGVYALDDNGSGSLIDTSTFGLAHEPTPQEAVRAGVHLTAFSGDKMLGGPQCGILVGESDVIARIARHPLARAFRPDKLILAALGATLLAYLRGDATRSIPLWRMIAQTADQIHDRAGRVQIELLKERIQVSLAEGQSSIGGGSLPTETLPTWLLSLPRHMTLEGLRRGNPPLIGRTRDRHVQIDLRSIPPEEDETVIRLLIAASQGLEAKKSTVIESVTP